MKRSIVFALILILSATLLTASTSNEDLYTLVVPTYTKSLFINGGFSPDDALRISLIMAPSPTAFGIDFGVAGMFRLLSQTTTTDFELDNLYSRFEFGTSGLTFIVNGPIRYSNYNLALGKSTGFYRFGAENLYVNLASNTTTINIEPYASLGLGRQYSIDVLKQMELAMRILGVQPTKENLRKAAEVRYRQLQLVNEFSTDTMQEHVSYYQQLATAMGVGPKALELSLISNSQQYSFDIQRYIGMSYGWELEARVRPQLDYNSWFGFSTTDFLLNLDLIGSYAGFAYDERLYYELGLTVTPSLQFTPTPVRFFIETELQANVRYLPPAKPWYIDADLAFYLTNINPPLSTSLDLRGTFNYLINPNFRVYSSLLFFINNAWGESGLILSAGGSIRIF